MRTHAHKSRSSEQQPHIRLGYLMAYLLNSRAVKIWPGWLFLLLGLAVADASYGQDTGGTTESSSVCSANPGTWTVRDGIISRKLTGYTYSDTGADLSKPIGGWDKYYMQRIITEKESESITYKKASNLTQLKNKLSSATSGDTIFVVGTADILVTERLAIPSGVTLASNRGQAISNVSGAHVSDGFALGALLRIDDLANGRPNLLVVEGDNVRITGLRLRGPQREVHPWDEGNDRVGIINSSLGSSGYENLEVDNCELFQWPQSAIYVGHGGSACIRNNYIHHNQRWKAGYGVGLQGEAKVSIEENLFAFNRHCVAGTGYPTQEYTARHNVVLASNNPPFDMHGLIESCPDGLNDYTWDCNKTQKVFGYDVTGTSRVGTGSGERYWHFGRSSQTAEGTTSDPPPDNQIGGKKIHITRNTVASVTNQHKPMDLAKRKGLNAGRFGAIAAVYLRGIPWMEAVVEHNSFAHSSRWNGAYKQVAVNTTKKYGLPYKFNESGNWVDSVWTHDRDYRRFFERFGDVFQEMEETTIPGNGRFLFSSDKWRYKWSADSGNGYRLKPSHGSQTWRVQNGNRKATTKSILLNRIVPNDRIGEMRSKRFQVNKRYVSFRIAGFKDVNIGSTGFARCTSNDSKYANQVAMLSAHNDSVIFKENVPCKESFVLYDHDLSDHQDSWAYFVLSDGDWHDRGWIEVDDIYFFDDPPTVQPKDLKAEAGDGEVTLLWEEPTVDDPSIREWAYSTKAGAGVWSKWKTIPGGRSKLKHTVSDLDHGVLHHFKVCAVNAAGEGTPSETSVALINVAYGAESYDVMEGGDPVEITVRLTPATDRKVKIPILAVSPDTRVVSPAEAEDYSLNSSMVSFAPGEDTQQVTITAALDETDTAEETLILGFGDSTPPEGVKGGDPARTTITIYEKLSPPSAALSAMAEINQIKVGWEEASASATPEVTGYKVQYRWAVVGIDDWSDYLPATTTGSGTLSYTHRLHGVVSDPGSMSVKHRFQYQVKAISNIGESDWSDRFPAGGAIPLPGHSAAIDSLAVDEQNVTVRWECPNYLWCDPVYSASVAPLRLQSRMQSGSGAWTDWAGVTSSQKTTVTHPVSTLNQALVHRFQTRAVNANGEPGFGSGWAVVVPLRAQAGDGTVQLGWDAPGRGVDSWQYRFKAGSAAWGAWQGVPDSDRTTLSHEVSSLMNGVSYQFQVRATYRGKVKVVSFIQSATLVGRLSLTASGGDGQVALSWTTPANSATIADYQVRQRISDSGQDWSIWATVPGGTTAHDTTVTGLTNGVTYQFQARALDSQDASVFVSDIVSATPAGVPDPPAVTATPLDGEVALTIRLTADNGSKVTQLEWLNSHINGVELNNRWGWVSGFADHRYPELFREGYTHRWEDLQNDLVYRFEVRVRNGQGASEIVSVTATPTPPTPPVEPPRNLAVGTPTHHSAPVEWDAPASTTGLAGYQVEWRVDGDTRWNSQNIHAATTHYTIPNLSSDTTYNWRVSSRASAGYAPSKPVDGDDFTTATPPSTTFRFIPPRAMESATVGLQYVFNRPNPVGGTGTIT